MFPLLLFYGAIIGSFIGALSYRLPRGISIASGFSQCPHCKEKIRWFDNIPIISYFLLRGSCRNCQKKISVRYPLIEGVSILGFLLIGSLVNPWIELIFLLTVFSLLLSIFVIDFEHQLIPDELVFTLISVSFLYLFLFSEASLYLSLLAGFLASTFLLIVNLLSKGRGMGLGDVKLAIPLGMIMAERSFYWLFGSFLTGAVVGIILILFKRKSLKSKIAFGPFLIISFFIFYFLQPETLKWLVLIR